MTRMSTTGDYHMEGISLHNTTSSKPWLWLQYFKYMSKKKNDVNVLHVSFCSPSVLHCALHFTTEGVGKHCEGLRPMTSLQLSFQQSRTITCRTVVLSCELVGAAAGAS